MDAFLLLVGDIFSGLLWGCVIGVVVSVIFAGLLMLIVAGGGPPYPNTPFVLPPEKDAGDGIDKSE